MFKEKMTAAELAEMTGYTRQTINKWILKHNWETCKKKAYREVKQGSFISPSR